MVTSGEYRSFRGAGRSILLADTYASEKGGTNAHIAG